MKDDLWTALREGRGALAGKLDGLSPYDAHRPLTPTGTSLLGLVKHVAFVQAGYFGVVFGRPFPEPAPGIDPGLDPDSDMWARADESTADIVGLLERSNAHADATIGALDLDAVGEVPWWGDGRRAVTLHRILVHTVAEVHRHAGHADILRELIDGTAGLRRPGDNLPSEVDAEGWAARRARIEEAARAATA